MSDLSVPYSWGEKNYVLEFTCGGLLEIAEKFGDGWSERLHKVFTGELADLEFVASVATGGDYDPAYNVPKAPLANALYRAYVLSWSGRDIEKMAESDEEGGKSEKKLKASLRRFFPTVKHG